jgi:hypothetical protein
MQVQAAINRTRRDLALGSFVKILLVAGAASVLLIESQTVRMAMLVAIGAAWVGLSFTSARGSRLAASSPLLIATGQFEQAEVNIDQALRAFSLFRSAKLQSLHYLAVLRHAQKRWNESAALCRAVLGQRTGSMAGLGKPAALVLADSLLEMNDPRGAYEAIRSLYQQRLSLGEGLHLMTLQLDYCSRIGAWQWMFDGVATKAQLAELMPTASAARAQAFLSLAAKKLNQPEWSDWLRQRAELLTDVQTLVTERPVLRELWTVA